MMCAMYYSVTEREVAAAWCCDDKGLVDDEGEQTNVDNVCDGSE